MPAAAIPRPVPRAVDPTLEGLEIGVLDDRKGNLFPDSL
jgi:hypothetical protein